MTREVYRHVTRWINSAFPQEGKWQQERLLLGTWAMLQRRSVCLSERARALPGKTSYHPKKKRLYRFFSQGKWEALSLLGEVIPTVLRRFGIREGKVAVSVDWTPLRPGEQALVAALPFQGRGIPLPVWATSWESLRRGTGQPDLEQAFLRRVLSALPEGIEPGVLADRGFGHVGFLRFLQGLRRALGRRSTSGSGSRAGRGRTPRAEEAPQGVAPLLGRDPLLRRGLAETGLSGASNLVSAYWGWPG